jgi:hypothetical protein
MTESRGPVVADHSGRVVSGVGSNPTFGMYVRVLLY